MSTRELDGRAVEFGTSGYTHEHVFVLYDRESDSVWYPLDERGLVATSGARQGEALSFVEEPSPLPLGEWLEQHPESTVLVPDEAGLARLVARRNRPVLGVQLGARDEGLYLENVVEHGPADEAGLAPEDRLIRLAGASLESRADLRRALQGHTPGDAVEVVFERAGERRVVELTLGRRE